MKKYIYIMQRCDTLTNDFLHVAKSLNHLSSQISLAEICLTKKHLHFDIKITPFCNKT